MKPSGRHDSSHGSHWWLPARAAHWGTLCLIWLLLYGKNSLSQPYGNEWIDYGQQYYKFSVVEDDIYRIDYTTLSNAGFPVATLDPRNFQLFARGEEQYIYVEGEADGVFDPADFIEFHGRKNDGWFDRQLYGGAAGHPNPYYSLFTDTATYYLSWNNSTTNRRMVEETDINFAAYTPASYCLKEEVLDFHTTYFDGQTHVGGATDAEYVPTEGWFDGAFNLGGTRSWNISTRAAYASGPPAIVSWALVGSSDHAPSNPDHHLNVQFASTVFDTIYEGYGLIRKNFTVPVSNLGTFNTGFTFRSINDIGSGADRSTISYITVKYPHVFDIYNLKTFRFFMPDQAGQSKARLDFERLNITGTARLYDLTNHKRVTVVAGGGFQRALLPNSGGEKECYLTAENQVRSVTSLSPVNGNGNFTDLLSLERDSAYIIVTHKKLRTAAAQYASYRSLSGFQVVTLEVDELYDQFAFGINTHPMAMRNAMDLILDRWATPPKHLFLIGKSVRARFCRKSPPDFANNLVPSFGNPASDILITSGLNGNILAPAIPTGRLSAMSEEQVGWYLDKVMEYESNPSAAWMKNILHFAGGSSQPESDRFAGYLKSYENILEDTLFGGTVFTFKKSTTAPIQITLSDSIAHLINGGASIMTFFGHASSSGGFDQNIDDPASYTNKGKYPLLVANSCFAGEIHGTSGFSTSEEFILVKDRGMIGFIAATDLGFESLLNLYSTNLFRNIGQTNYGRSVGSGMQNVIKAIEGNGSNPNIRSVCFEMTLHGDPAIVVNAHDKPDYEVNEAGVFFTPSDVTAETDSFDINIVITNLGKALKRDITVTVARHFPINMNADTVYHRFITGVPFHDTLSIRMPVDLLNGDGLNRFDITVDAFAIIDELREDNNFVSAELFIRSGNLLPVLPYNYAIVPEQGVELIASTGYPFEKAQSYLLQLDTTDLFNSPLFQETTVTQAGGVIKWQPSVLSSMPSEQVYFWRTSRQAKEPGDLNWKESSFQYIPGKRGWSQDHFFQFKNDEYLFVDHNRNTRRFDFITSLKKLTCVTISTRTVALLSNVDYKIDADRIEWNGCGLNSAIHIAILDSLTFKPWGTPFMGENPLNDFGQLNKNGNCGKNRVQNFFIFNANNPAHLAGLKDMLTNKVPDGHYILAYTWVRNDFSKWDIHDPTMRQVFTDLGATVITSISNDTLPYIFFVKKGIPASAMEVVGSEAEQFITLKADLMNNTTFGNIGSELIGPASRWDSLIWDHFSLETVTADSLSLRLSGVTATGAETVRIPAIAAADKKISIRQDVDPQLDPFLKLTSSLIDDSLQTAPQLDKWQVLYEGVPEAAINSDLHFSFYNDTLQEGDMLTFSVAVENISDYDMDSLLIDYYVLDKDREKHLIPYPRQGKLPADSIMISTVEYSTVGLSGMNILVIEVNPNHDQPEQHHFNNTGQLPFYVVSDNANPLLDVTFDGIHILDGDIISPQPEIVIQLSDENKYLALNDTSDFRVWLTNPEGQERAVPFAGSGGETPLQFIPASLPKNTARIIYRPKLAQDGVYQLRVQASDRSNNESGDIDYRISFEVINRSTITNLLNYPNPFTTSTRFVFILTGSRIPEAIQIQIMTITGKLVKTIDAGDIGPIRIGRNITEYAWDGRDDFGDRLANGVYLYRVKARINGENIEHRPTSADKYFKKGFGKMYLMR